MTKFKSTQSTFFGELLDGGTIAVKFKNIDRFRDVEQTCSSDIEPHTMLMYKSNTSFYFSTGDNIRYASLTLESGKRLAIEYNAYLVECDELFERSMQNIDALVNLETTKSDLATIIGNSSRRHMAGRSI